MYKENQSSENQDAYYFEEFKKAAAHIGTQEGLQDALNLKLNQNDIMIATSPKCGTTWVQQICHQLRSRGDMDFGEITQVIPYIELADEYNVDIHHKQKYQPTIYKTHFWYDMCPKGGKYIYVTRNPHDTANSFYHFFGDWVFKKENISIDYFVEHFWLQRGVPGFDSKNASYFHHLISYYFKRRDKDVLWLHYEDLVENMRKCIILIAEFMNIDTSDVDLINLVEKQSTFEFMKKHNDKYNDGPLKENFARKAGFSARIDHEGKVSAKYPNKEKMSPDMRVRVDEKWKKIVTSTIGYKTYEEMRAGINKELNRDFS